MCQNTNMAVLARSLCKLELGHEISYTWSVKFFRPEEDYKITDWESITSNLFSCSTLIKINVNLKRQ